ncbi:ABC transporter substrate-binding protein [Microbulbifer taiwanensis]|uniref:ABC transporter substrate-binding protein n=1 Tax=Microbulbifer taiwanensis TaxID=986746 RepID=A0ABW1YPD5_9GAMM|nr:ABC transporter substrate-binding protein [Microbulbifer taiwanensis]
MTLYLGRGEGGLYENVLEAIRKRNPKLNLQIRRGVTAALANTIVAEARAGVRRADVFWAVDSGAIGLVAEAGLARPLPADLTGQLKSGFQYPQWAPVTGRIRTLPYNTERVSPEQIPDSVMALADSKLSIGWAPAYASFQSFVTGMRLLEGDKVTADWLRGVNARAKSYAGELGVVMGVERGEVDLGFANHYYTLRLKSGKPDAKVDLAFTKNDAGCLVNASGILALSEGDLPINFIRYLLTQEVQSYLASEAYEIPLVNSVAPPAGLPPLSRISPPKVDLTQLADLRPTLKLMRNIGVL